MKSLPIIEDDLTLNFKHFLKSTKNYSNYDEEDPHHERSVDSEAIYSEVIEMKILLMQLKRIIELVS